MRTRQTIRDSAVYRVDTRKGYTAEFSPDPAAHRAEYDKEEKSLMEQEQRNKPLEVTITLSDKLQRILENLADMEGYGGDTFEAIILNFTWKEINRLRETRMTGVEDDGRETVPVYIENWEDFAKG